MVIAFAHSTYIEKEFLQYDRTSIFVRGNVVTVIRMVMMS